jgi:hypothetical protein
VGQADYDDVNPIVREQILIGGVALAAVLRADASQAFRVGVGDRPQVRRFKGRYRPQMSPGYAASTDDSDSMHFILDSKG